ncbi:ABC transporter substrate-binding protein [Ktedonosporobacter rubrisoli]|uniref:ABC transporter substrate-binding protein n=1 Tax=Ktedonosporobacter rubrisoli TaxID=2509675 RepID=A0A4P6K4Z1_KTERU|nr:ABC transporter substrate-binding protein [Ktedonosporobacter rubrisoli]QBD82596.1 ABC transporter substrate-binding protein [Ktedonosporobacter rubrisoli]
MFTEQREVIDESITKIRSGRITRRSFLERVMTAGLSSAAALSLLEACGGTTNSSAGNGPATNIVWQSENDSTTTYRDLASTFNQTVGKQKGIHITWTQGPSDTQAMLSKYNTLFRSRSSSIDIIALDIVYPAQFAAQQWTKPITESMWPASERQNYLQAPLKGCTFAGKLWAAPYRTGVGILYYRKDLVSSPPATYDDLVHISKDLAPAKTKYGYVWQGGQSEVLTCNFVEVLHGYGGAVLDPNDPTRVTINSPEAQQALSMMVSWVGTISPTAVTTYTEEPSRITWQNGNAAFMRNWPYAYPLGNNPASSKIANKFDIAPLPHGPHSPTGHSAIGGWNMAINTYSRYPEQAWEFIHYMLQPAAQKQGAIGAGWPVTLQSAYDDPDVLAKEPFFGKLKPILQTALPRPVSPKYVDISDVLQRSVHQALLKQETFVNILQATEAQLKPLVAQKP